jgi:hypothetical protein
MVLRLLRGSLRVLHSGRVLEGDDEDDVPSEALKETHRDIIRVS